MINETIVSYGTASKVGARDGALTALIGDSGGVGRFLGLHRLWGLVSCYLWCSKQRL